MADAPAASIVVTVHGDRRLYRLLAALRAQTAQHSDFEVIVVENGTAEFALVAEEANAGPIRYIHLPEANMAAARQVGLEHARGRYLLLTDADVVPEPNWVEAMTQSLSQGEYAAVGGPILKHNPRTWTQRHAMTIVDGQRELSYLPILPFPYVAGANSGFVTALVRAVGGFDPQFKSGNDVDLCYRLSLAGHRVGLAPDAVIAHEDRATACGHFHRFRRYAIYQVLLFAKYRAISRRRFLINPYPIRRVAEAFRSIPRSLWRAMRGDWRPAQAALLLLIEAAGVWCGDVQGSVRFRQIYL